MVEKACGHKVDIIINNGGISQRDEFKDLDFKVVQQMINCNTLSPIAIIKSFMPDLMKRKDTQIVNILSLSGVFPTPVRTMYCASKYGLDGFGKSLRSEVK
jgi:short-subunit dehydrogenase